MAKIDELRGAGWSGGRGWRRGLGGLPKIVVDSELGAGEIYLHGGACDAFSASGAERVLYLSSASVFDGVRPIRGGVPLVFPWFGPRADMRGRFRRMVCGGLGSGRLNLVMLGRMGR